MANNTKGLKDAKKRPDKEDRLLPELDDSDSADLECDICGVTFSNGKAYESHMQGKKHQKKVNETRLMAKDLAADKKSGSDEDDEGDDEEMHCEVCDKYFSGYIPYSSHLKGSVHAKNAKKMKLKQKLGDMPDVLADENGSGDSEDDEILSKPYARCKICQKEFSGPENYQKHLKSAMHKKKINQQKLLNNLKSNHEDGAKDDDEEAFSKCDVCQKSFSGIVPYNIHMKSNIHKKNLEKQKVAEEMKEFYDNDDCESGYVCKECKKLFTDPMAFKCHLANNSHEKQKAKDALKKFLKEHPEIVFVSPLSEDDSEGRSDSGDLDCLICKLCHFSFSGPESAQDHVKSKKHISLKKEKEMQKFLKEKKKDALLKANYKEAKDNEKSNKDISTNGKPNSPPENNTDDFEMI